MIMKGVQLQQRDVMLLGLAAQFPYITADALTRFVMPQEHWGRALAGADSAQVRHHVTRSVRERMVKLERAGLVDILTDAYSRAAYEVTSVGARFAELSPLWVDAPVTPQPHTLDLLEQAKRAAGSASWRYIFRRGAVIAKAVIVRADVGASPLQRAEVERAVQASGASGLIAVARQRNDAERVRAWGEDLHLTATVARGDVLASGYYKVTGLDRDKAQAAIRGD
ncbi:hypothetical protein [Brachybacterium alimentarium]|uniref:hypothetical protein n=1 Tax=Brachybacterium alimentarium TaxID=47845 RepID=UPI0011C0205E|nr:hypothetical protein [Brachybacterium alimentarium]